MFDLPSRHARRLLMLPLAVGLVACSTYEQTSSRIVTALTPYRMDIVQGNVVTREQTAALQPGMSRLQVRDILGTPLLASVFHGDRWDYVFTFKRQGQEPQSRRVTVFFKADVLEHFESDPLPSEAEFAATLDAREQSNKVPELQASPEALAKFPPPAPKEVKPLPPLPASYPPLEPLSR